MGAALGMPKHIFDDVAKKWETFKGPVKNFQKFSMEVELHEARAGYIVAFVQYYKGRVNLGVIVEPYDDAMDDMIYEAFDGDPPMKDEGFASTLWDLTPMVETIRRKKTKKDRRPNDPCWCNSGKKFKRCHGRNG